VGILVINPSGQISITNESASTILGYTKEQLIGKGWAELFFETEENIDFNQVIVDVIQEERLNLHRSVQYMRKSGELLYLSMTTSFLKAEHGLEGIVVLLDDVTVLCELQEREKVILEEKNRIQREKAESLHKLASAVAHQLRNPLTAIGGLTALMSKRIGNEEPYNNYFQDIMSDVKRLERIVKSVEEYTNVQEVAPVKMAMAEIVDELCEQGNILADSLSRTITWNVQCDQSEITVDPKSFMVALREVVRNSVEFLGRSEGLIRIKAFQENHGWIVIEVTDNGSGISDEDLPFIFDPFYTTKTVGVGMGLCKVKRIIADHDGKVSIESRLGIGTKVRIEFPNPWSS